MDKCNDQGACIHNADADAATAYCNAHPASGDQASCTREFCTPTGCDSEVVPDSCPDNTATDVCETCALRNLIVSCICSISTRT